MIYGVCPAVPGKPTWRELWRFVCIGRFGWPSWILVPISPMLVPGWLLRNTSLDCRSGLTIVESPVANSGGKKVGKTVWYSFWLISLLSVTSYWCWVGVGLVTGFCGGKLVLIAARSKFGISKEPEECKNGSRFQGKNEYFLSFIIYLAFSNVRA